MVKTIRIKDDELHSQLLQIQGEIQAETGEATSMEDAIDVLILIYHGLSKKEKTKAANDFLK